MRTATPARSVRLAAALAGALAAGGCADHAYDPNAPAVDPTAPVVHITSPARGTQVGDLDHVIVAGTASDDTGVTAVEVNGVAANLSPDGTFTVTVPVVAGTNLLHAVARDAEGNAGKETRAVSAGPLAPIDTEVPEAITATLSAQTFDALGRGAAGFIRTGDLEALIAPHNPVVDAGAPNGPDCLYGQASITGIHVAGATIDLAPQTGGLYIDAELSGVTIDMHLDYAAACIDGSRDVVVSADHLSVTGPMTVGVVSNRFDIHLDNPDVQITGFHLDLGGIPGAVVSALSLDTAMGPLLGWAVERFVVPMLNRSLDGLNTSKTIDVLGKPVSVSVLPARIDFDPTGATVELSTVLRALDDGASPGFVYVRNALPAMDQGRGFQLAVADDAANQLLASFWAARGLDLGFDLKTGNYGEVGKLYDHVDVTAMVPPYLDASRADALKLTLGDLMVTFKRGEAAVTRIAVNAEVGLKVVTDATGALRLDVGTPKTYVDILDEDVDGANQLSNSQFEALSTFALGRVVSIASGAVGAIPLPSVGGVSVADVSIGQQTGYLVVQGAVR